MVLVRLQATARYIHLQTILKVLLKTNHKVHLGNKSHKWKTYKHGTENKDITGTSGTLYGAK